MKAPVLFILFVMVAINQCSSQPGIPEFGKVSPAELFQKECSFEKEASAYYLVNAANVEFKLYSDGSSRVKTERRVRIKIINQKGFEFASVSIPYIGTRKSSKINDIEAFIYTLDSSGAVVKKNVDKNDIFKTHAGRKPGLNMVRFTFPGLKPGCIIEYRYEHIENDKYDIEPWLLQNEIPVALSYFQISYPGFSLLDYRQAGQFVMDEENYKEWTIDSTKDVYKKAFLMKNIPSFRSEPLMTSLVDNLKRIEFSLNPSPGFMSVLTNNTDAKWKMLNIRLNFSYRFGLQFNKAIPGSEKLIDSIKALKISRDKINAVYQSVKNQVTWDKSQSLYPDDIVESWKNKSGNSAEINLILLNLLRKTGVECYPMLISTRENGKTDTHFAHLSQFNGVDVLAIDSNIYYVLDASIKNQPYIIPPLNVINRDALIIMSDNPKWVNVSEVRPLIKDSVNVTAKMDKDGKITGEAITTCFDLSKYIRLTEEFKSDKNTNDLLTNDFPDIKSDTSWSTNKTIDSLPLTEYVKFHYELPNTNNFYFLNPYLFNSFRKNPFTDSLRITDVDFGCNQLYTQMVKIELPPNMIIENIPKSILIRTEDSSMIYTRVINQRALNLYIRNEFTLKKSLFYSEEYPVLRDFFKKVYALLSEEVLLNKKE